MPESDRIAEQWRRCGALQRVKTSAGDFDINVRIAGSAAGRALLLLHGFPTSSLDWARIAPHLSDCRMIAPDLLGFGGSSKPRLRYRYALQAEIVSSIVCDLGLTNVDIVAHDYSTTLAQELLRQENVGALPFKISRVVFLNGAVYGALHRARFAQNLLRTPVIGQIAARRITQDRFLQGLRAVAGRPGAWADEDGADHFAPFAAPSNRAIVPSLLHYIKDRQRQGSAWEAAMEIAADHCAFVWGEADPVSGRHVVAAVRERMPRAYVRSFQNVGHYPQWEAPAETAAAIRAALGERT